MLNLVLAAVWLALSIVHAVDVSRAVSRDNYEKAAYHSIWFLAGMWWINHLLG